MHIRNLKERSRGPRLELPLAIPRDREEVGLIPWASGTGRRHRLPQPQPQPHRIAAERGRDRLGGQLRSHLLRGRQRPPQCLFTIGDLRAGETRFPFQARGSRCQPGRRGRRGPGT